MLKKLKLNGSMKTYIPFAKSLVGPRFGLLFPGFRQPPAQWPVLSSMVSFSPATGPCNYKLRAIPTSWDIDIFKAPPIFRSFFCLSELF